jgi:hypothetical protein
MPTTPLDSTPRGPVRRFQAGTHNTTVDSCRDRLQSYRHSTGEFASSPTVLHSATSTLPHATLPTTSIIRYTLIPPILHASCSARVTQVTQSNIGAKRSMNRHGTHGLRKAAFQNEHATLSKTSIPKGLNTTSMLPTARGFHKLSMKSRQILTTDAKKGASAIPTTSAVAFAGTQPRHPQKQKERERRLSNTNNECGSLRRYATQASADPEQLLQ